MYERNNMKEEKFLKFFKIMIAQEKYQKYF